MAVSVRALAVVALVAAGLACAALFLSQVFSFSASPMLLWSGGGVEDVNHVHYAHPATRYEVKERVATAKARERWSAGAAFTFGGVAALTTVWAGWRSRRDIREWHWLSFFALTLLVAVLALALYPGALGDPGALGVLVLLGAALVAVFVDLRRKKYGSPARPVAWTTLALVIFFMLWFVLDAVGILF